VRTIVVCTGGGGLIAGIALAVKALRPEVVVVGAQAEGAASYAASLAAGHPVRLEKMATMADGIAVGQPGEVPFALVRQHVDRIVTVSEASLSRALLLALERAKLVVEPAGVAGMAAVLDDPSAFEPPVVVVLSGGNIDPLLLLRVLRYGMTAAGRYLSLRVRIPDKPGNLAVLLAAVGGSGANVVEVEHMRTEPGIAVDEVEVALQLETQGPEHTAEVVVHLQALGYALRTT